MHRLTLSLLSVSIALTAAACGYEDLDIRQAHMTGELGEVTGIDDPIDRVRGQNRDGYTSLHLTSEPGSDAAMMIVDFNEGLYAYPAGTTHSFSGSDGYEVSVIGCSGPGVGQWDYDNSADAVEVTVDEDPDDPDRLMYTVTAWFPGEPAFWGDGLRPTIATSTFSVPADPELLEAPAPGGGLSDEATTR